MNYENNQNTITNSVGDNLRQLEQYQPPRDLFADIQSGIHIKEKKSRSKWLGSASVAAVLMLSYVFVIQNQKMAEKDNLIEQLVEKTMQLEQLLAQEELYQSDPGSVITERIINMEAWIAKLDTDIKSTKDKNKKSKLMAAKIGLLKDIVQLQKKVNQRPDYQKLKPFVI